MQLIIEPPKYLFTALSIAFSNYQNNYAVNDNLEASHEEVLIPNEQSNTTEAMNSDQIQNSLETSNNLLDVDASEEHKNVIVGKEHYCESIASSDKNIDSSVSELTHTESSIF